MREHEECELGALGEFFIKVVICAAGAGIALFLIIKLMGLVASKGGITTILAHPIALLPIWVWATIGTWIYLNLGWRFSKYITSLPGRWRETPLIIIHFLFPAWSAHAYPADKPVLEISDTARTFLFFPRIIYSFSMTAVLWLFWLATMGTLRPIHSQILQHYRIRKEQIRQRELDDARKEGLRKFYGQGPDAF